MPAVSDHILIQLPGPLPENWVRVVDRVQEGNRATVNILITETGWLFYQQFQWETLTDYLLGNE